jgi:hypothetical protein
LEKFDAEIKKLGINPFVFVPEKVVSSLLANAGKKNLPVQVKGTLNGKTSFTSTVVRYQGAFRLFVNTQMRKDAKVEVGDDVCVELEYDPSRRMPPIPDAFRKALHENGLAKERWRLYPTSRRKEILDYLNSLKTEASLERNVARILRILPK